MLHLTSEIVTNQNIAQTVITIINTVGFPIAVCVFCGWYMVTTGKQMSKAMDNLTTSVNKLVTIVETQLKN